MNRVAISLVVVAAASAALFYGTQQLRHWKHESVKQAVQQEQERWMVDVEKLKGEVKDLKDELYSETKLETHEQKVNEVLGTLDGIAPYTDTPGCTDSEQRLLAFFEYLNKKYPAEPAPLDRFQGALSKLAASTPEISEKDLDTLALFRNVAHLYRTLGPEDLITFKRWIDLEPDAVEAFLPDLYKVMMDGTCTRVVSPDCTREVAAHYATFFLNTLAGRSYLLRRSSRYRILATYYSVQVIHQADLSGTNIFGVNLRPVVANLQSEIALYKGLARQKEYLASLETISTHYQNR